MMRLYENASLVRSFACFLFICLFSFGFSSRDSESSANMDEVNEKTVIIFLGMTNTIDFFLVSLHNFTEILISQA